MTDDDIETRLNAIIDREKADGCTMADPGLIQPAIRRWRSYERRHKKHKNKSHDHRVRDLTKGLLALFPEHNYDEGCIKHLAQSFASVLDPDVPDEEVRTAHGPAPSDCLVCGSTDFSIAGRVGHWDGRKGGGDIYGAVCNSCDTAWVGRARGVPIVDIYWEIEDNPWWLDDA